MHHVAVALGCIACLCTLAHAEPKPADARPADPRAALDPLAKSLIDGEYCVGIVVGLISRSAPPRVLAWGETVRGNHKQPDGNTVFEIGSVTKVFTSLLLAEAVVDKQVTLDTPVASLLPAKAKLPAGKRPITLLDLATHTSGLPRLPDNMHPADTANPYADYTTDQLYSFLAGMKLDREPGARYEYSNLGAGLLGHALALRGKTDWPTLVAAQITKPLAMTSTMVALTPDAKARFAQAYDADGEPVKPWDLPALAGAGALRSTANDLMLLLRAELAAAREPRTRLAQAMALTQKPQHDLSDAAKGKIGLAWHIEPDGTLWHNGGTGGFHSFVAVDPKRQLAVVVLANGSASQIDDLGNAAVNAAAGEPVPPSFKLPPPDMPVDEKTLESYVGKYPLAPTFVVEISHSGGKLFAQPTGQPRIRLHATSTRDFAIHIVPASVTFEVDAKGKVTGLVLHQGGQDQRAPRQ
ncbi:MAG TPA: serine hydrolase [Kofleriaceae bacterium]|jgi:CubicO group peptidase (beta-lactamase class C family)